MRLSVVVACIALAGCGGGGSGGSNGDVPSSPLGFNADQAFSTLLTTPNSFNGLTARDSSGNTYTLTVSFTPTADAILNGKTYRQSVQNSVVSKNGVVPSGEKFPTHYLFSVGPTKLEALLRDGRADGFSPLNTSHTLFNTSGALPTSGAVGSSGTLASGVSYGIQLPSTSTSAPITGNAPLLWSIEADTSSTAFACLSTPSEKDCLRINSAGNILGGRISVNVDGQVLTFQ